MLEQYIIRDQNRYEILFQELNVNQNEESDKEILKEEWVILRQSIQNSEGERNSTKTGAEEKTEMDKWRHSQPDGGTEKKSKRKDEAK